MKVSLNWMEQVSPVKLAPDGIDTLVEKIGAQLGAVEEVVDLGAKYKGIVVAKVVACVKHPNADKLSLCLIDDAGVTKHVKRDPKGLVQVVCGAPNVKAGMLVAWLPPGVTVPSTIDKEPLVLEARDIRGQVSNGMLASAHELGISDDHSGILEITEPGAKPGQAFMYVYGLNDYIIDIENKMFTHRPDLFGQLGVAREIAGIEHQKFSSPKWYSGQNSFVTSEDSKIKGLEVVNEVPDLCQRYMAIVVSGIKVGPSPMWLQSYLARVGIRPINNIVDMTNYIMMLTAQPLHAFDFDKVAVNGKAKIVVRNPRKGEKMTLLDGRTIEPRKDAVLICDADKPIALGGVMGGSGSEIGPNTTRIIIECATFDMYNIRKTAMEHGIFTDAVTRFTKGQSPLQCPPVLYKAVQMTKELCPEAMPIGKVADQYKKLPEPEAVEVTAEFINARLGLELSATEMAQLLENVEFEVDHKNGKLTVAAPFWRTDIAIPEDVVEEIGRLYGYDHLPLVLPKRDLTPVKPEPLLSFKSQLRHALRRVGANEVLTYSFVHEELLKKVGQDPKYAYKLSNALSPELQYYRLSLLPSLLEKVHPNIKAGYDEFALYEINKVHDKSQTDKQGLPIEDERLALVWTANPKAAAATYHGAAYYQARLYVTDLLQSLGISPVFQPLDQVAKQTVSEQQSALAFEPTRSAYIKTANGEPIGLIGEFRAKVAQSLKLPNLTAGFELDTALLMKLANPSTRYLPIPRYPKVTQDISLKVPTKLTYQQVYDFVWNELTKIQPPDTLPSLSPVDIYQSQDDKTHKNITLRLSIASYQRTLTDTEVNALLDQVAQAAKTKLGAERL